MVRPGQAFSMSATRWLDRLDAAVGRHADRAAIALRAGLGLVILLSGAHKLVAPGAWHAYLAPPFAAVWPTALVPLDPTFVLFGVSEVLFGLLLIAGWHVPTVAVLTALSLAGVVVNLAVGVMVGEPVVDVLIRDLGLTVLAFGVALQSAKDYME